jgi:hypothetical protein
MAIAYVWCCGSECGYTSGLANGNHYDIATIGAGGAITSDTAVVHPAGGSRSLKVVAAANITYAQGPVAAGTTCAMVGTWLNFGSSFPDSTGVVLAITTSTGSTTRLGSVRYNPAGNILEGFINGGTAAGSFAVALNTWYYLGMRYDVGATTYATDWWVNGAAQTQATLAGQTIGTVGKPRFGQGTAAVTSTTYYDAMAYATCANTDAIWTPGLIRGARIVATGTHNQTAGDLQDDASANLTNGDGSWAKVDEVPVDGGADFIKQVVIRSTSYAEYIYDKVAGGQTPRAMEQVVAFHNITTAANTQKAQLWDGTTAADTYALVSSGSVAGQIATRSKQWATAPTGAWTPTLADSCRLRWGFSTDVTDVPALDSSVGEFEFAIEKQPDVSIMPPILAQ